MTTPTPPQPPKRPPRSTKQGPVDQLQDAALSVWVADRLKDQYACVTGFGWMKRAEHIWVPADDQMLTVIMDQLVIRPRLLAALMGGNPKDYSHLESTRVAVQVEKVLRGRLRAHVSEFDADPEELNCPNGVVDLRTGELRDHEPSDRFMRSTAVDYLRGYTSEYWSAALESMDPETRDWMQRRFGHAITAHPPLDDKLLLLIGSGDNGKTTIVDGPVTVLGSYAAQVSDQVLTAGDSDHSTEQMDLKGLRLAIMEELPGGRYVNVGRLKKVVGTKSTTARRMRQDPVTFSNTHSLIVTSNYQPKIVETDHATWRRLLCVPFPFRYIDDPLPDSNERQKRPEIRQAMRAGDPAVLAWLVAGAVKALADRRAYEKVPAAVAALSKSVRDDNNTVLEFFTERTTEGEFAPSVVQYQAYADWMKTRGRQAPPIEVFTERVHDALGYVKVRRRWNGKQVMGYVGVELIGYPANLHVEDL